MPDGLSIDSKRLAGFAVAVLMCRATGAHLTGFMIRILPYELMMITSLIGYGLTGILLGLCMFYFLGGKAKYFLKWLPLLLLCAVLLSSYLNVFSAGRASDWSVFGIIRLYLTRLSGYSYLLFLPFVSAVTIYYFEVRKSGGNAESPSFKSWLKNVLVKQL